MKTNVRRSLQELSSKALGTVRGGVRLPENPTSTNFEERVQVGGVVYVYDSQGRLIRTYMVEGGGGGGW